LQSSLVCCEKDPESDQMPSSFAEVNNMTERVSDIGEFGLIRRIDELVNRRGFGLSGSPLESVMIRPPSFLALDMNS